MLYHEPLWLEILELCILFLCIWVLPEIGRYRTVVKRLWVRYTFRRGHERIKRRWGMPGRLDRFLQSIGKNYDPPRK